MSLLFNCQSLSKAFTTRILFKELSFSVFEGDRIGLIGPNGSGKSTLLKILSGIENASSGTLSPKRGLKIGYVPQSAELPDLLPSEILLKSLRDNHEMADYEKEVLVQTWLSKLGFNGPEISAQRLSGGWKKRLTFAQAMISTPDILLLDEPTNHLDLEGILWLEKFLVKESPTYVLVSHDRYFLQNMTNRIIEIDPVHEKGLFSIDGSYANFLEKKEEFLKGQIQQERSIASKARRELEWLRKSPKARTTKAQSRVDDAHEILQELSEVKHRNKQNKATIDFAATQRESRKLIVAKNISKEIGGRTLFQHLDFTLSPGIRIGLMGPNGSGKTTLLKLLLGELTPDQGTLKNADDLKVVYFDQHRTQLPDDITLKDALSPTGDFVNFRGQMIHVNGWCKRFLFSPDILGMRIGKLSGGERARIAVAHLMLQPADVLLLDEPTNDLDIPTLETLEESLMDFPGAIVLITHDRYMLDRTCTTLLALGDLDKNEFYADYRQWEASTKSGAKSAAAASPKSSAKPQEPATPLKPKISFTEKKELDQIEAKILKLEEQIQQYNHLLETTEVAGNPERLQLVCKDIGLAENQVEQLYLRWELLEKKSQG